MRKLMLMLAVVAIGTVAFAANSNANNTVETKKPKHTVKVIMGKAFKGGLWKKVASGEASAEETHALLDMFVSLSEFKPKKGSAESWKAKTDALIVAAAKVAAGRKDAGALAKATSCKACHNVHK